MSKKSMIALAEILGEVWEQLRDNENIASEFDEAIRWALKWAKSLGLPPVSPAKDQLMPLPFLQLDKYLLSLQVEKSTLPAPSQGDIRVLRSETKALTTEKQELVAALRDSRREHANLSADNSSLTALNRELSARVEQLKAELNHARQWNAEKDKLIDEHRSEIEGLYQERADLILERDRAQQLANRLMQESAPDHVNDARAISDSLVDDGDPN
jgi:hypothetical protein